VVELIILIARSDEDDRFVFWCPMCETAWFSVPPKNVVDSVATLDELAPNGVRLPRADEIRRLEGVTTIPSDEWADRLQELLPGKERG
jgi:hypothetical protein